MAEPSWSIDGAPGQPGVYLFRDAAERVLYVGKARNLKARLRSYRRPGGDGRLVARFLEERAARGRDDRHAHRAGGAACSRTR